MITTDPIEFTYIECTPDNVTPAFVKKTYLDKKAEESKRDIRWMPYSIYAIISRFSNLSQWKQLIDISDSKRYLHFTKDSLQDITKATLIIPINGFNISVESDPLPPVGFGMWIDGKIPPYSSAQIKSTVKLHIIPDSINPLQLLDKKIRLTTMYEYEKIIYHKGYFMIESLMSGKKENVIKKSKVLKVISADNGWIYIVDKPLDINIYI